MSRTSIYPSSLPKPLPLSVVLLTSSKPSSLPPNEKSSVLLGFLGIPFSSVPKPVAITVIVISSSFSLSRSTPKMMLASSSAAARTIPAAVSISSRPISSEAEMLIITPLAPSIVDSRRGLEIAL